jgi:hypothetical protein
LIYLDAGLDDCLFSFPPAVVGLWRDKPEERIHKRRSVIRLRQKHFRRRRTPAYAKAFGAARWRDPPTPGLRRGKQGVTRRRQTSDFLGKSLPPEGPEGEFWLQIVPSPILPRVFRFQIVPKALFSMFENHGFALYPPALGRFEAIQKLT